MKNDSNTSSLDYINHHIGRMTIIHINLYLHIRCMYKYYPNYIILNTNVIITIFTVQIAYLT